MSLPIIDLSGMDSSDAAQRAKVGDTLRAACLQHGFFYCTGHGVPESLMQAAMDQSRAFFDLSDAEKDALDKSQSPANRGYETLGGQTLQPGALPDRKEGYYIGEDLTPTHPRVLAGEFNAGANLWPSDLPGFRPVMVAYFAALGVVGARIMRGLALSLSLPEDHFDAFTNEPAATLRLLHYPPSRPEVPDELGAGAHTDFGGLTILMTDEVGGLQVCDPTTQEWFDAPPIPGAYVVNLGDMIARWTNDRYRSTLHRVINRSGRERYSIPYFYSGNPNHEVTCIPSCLEPGERPKYPSVRVQDHLRAMYAKTYAT
jgi:isopenicillin N synthase-like dioxygenase